MWKELLNLSSKYSCNHLDTNSLEIKRAYHLFMLAMQPEEFDTVTEVPFYPKFNDKKIKSSILCHYDIK